MLLNDRLVQIREATGMTKKEVAKIIGVAPSTYGNYELGKRQPSLAVLDKISYLYSVSTDYLLGLTNNPDKYVGDPSRQISHSSSIAQLGDFQIIDGKAIRYKDMPEAAQKELDAFLRYLKHTYNL